MTTPTPRERLADAVKALDAITDIDAVEETNAAEDEVLAAARALLAAPDDAAELRAVKALLGCRRYTIHPAQGSNPIWVAYYGTELVATAPTAAELCRKLEVSYE